MDFNPWAVTSIHDFSFYCCPTCDHRSQDKQDFVDHAIFFHTKGFETTQKMIKDDSLSDVIIVPHVIEDCKVEVKEESVKNECNSDENNSELDISRESIEVDEQSSSEMKFPCWVCKYAPDRGSLLKTHMRKLHKTQTRKNYPCPECGANCYFLKTLKRHLLLSHNRDDSQNINFLCSLCGKNLKTKSYFKKHQREVHGIENRVRISEPLDTILKTECSKCSQEFVTTSDLNVHIKLCQEESKDFQCPQCETFWATGPVLNLHLKKDHGIGEIHTCHICGKCLKMKESVKNHIKTEHDQIKDQLCTHCGKTFALKSKLKKHIINAHERSGKYQCTYCDYRNSCKDTLEVHVNQVHTKAIKYSCEQCEFFSYRKQGLRDHVKIVHLKIKPFKCTFCGKAFVRPKELENHKSRAAH